MPLFPCPSCGRMISDQAPACPQCGHPFRVPPRAGGPPGWVWGCIVAVPLFFVMTAVVGMLAAIALPSFARAREMARMNACQQNLERIDAAVETSNPQELRSALNAVCPDEGVYSAGPGAVCSVHGTLAEIRTGRSPSTRLHTSSPPPQLP